MGLKHGYNASKIKIYKFDLFSKLWEHFYNPDISEIKYLFVFIKEFKFRFQILGIMALDFGRKVVPMCRSVYRLNRHQV